MMGTRSVRCRGSGGFTRMLSAQHQSLTCNLANFIFVFIHLYASRYSLRWTPIWGHSMDFAKGTSSGITCGKSKRHFRLRCSLMNPFQFKCASYPENDIGEKTVSHFEAKWAHEKRVQINLEFDVAPPRPTANCIDFESDSKHWSSRFFPPNRLDAQWSTLFVTLFILSTTSDPKRAR